MGCGPQEEFRACSDVTITTSDGSADNTINTLIDPEIYVPEDDVRYNEVDFDETMENYDKQLRDEVQVESVVIIVLCSLLVTVLFFGTYYVFSKICIFAPENCALSIFLLTAKWKYLLESNSSYVVIYLVN